MNENPGIPDAERGLYPKYRAIRVPAYKEYEGFYDDQAPLKNNGVPMEEVTEPFFLLKFNDPHARVALEAYADACRERFPRLAEDIKQKLDEVEEDIQQRVNALNAAFNIGPNEMFRD